MINSHAHLDFDNMIDVAENAIAIIPSIGKQNWIDVQMYPYFAFGIHPWMVQDHSQQELDYLEYLVKCNNPVAIGECGLDYLKDIDKKIQLYFFNFQLSLAEKYKLPVIIHSVKATEDVIFLLKMHPKISGEIHGFSGSEDQAKQLTSMGFYLGFGLQILNKKSTKIRQIVKNCPLEFMLIETDDHQNPNDLQLVAQEIALLKQIPIDTITTQCDNNAISLFNLK
ncbi:MAG: TatD family hydrolase [Candidatus Thioglobus sp.]|uniref:TatD family hydrolase n=1 Tax=Candidatus Thioglobus sp. TaxID=2026721 RepID=UPI0025BD22B4|nr:TatD family hydrolase [Candidatus Thioglobus sp.]MBT3277246.1 TatD family hydrolase [Candidatus Thioglobus sp.]